MEDAVLSRQALGFSVLTGVSPDLPAAVPEPPNSVGDVGCVSTPKLRRALPSSHVVVLRFYWTSGI
jgi:hypothetical protein